MDVNDRETLILWLKKQSKSVKKIIAIRVVIRHFGETSLKLDFPLLIDGVDVRLLYFYGASYLYNYLTYAKEEDINSQKRSFMIEIAYAAQSIDNYAQNLNYGISDRIAQLQRKINRINDRYYSQEPDQSSIDYLQYEIKQQEESQSKIGPINGTIFQLLMSVLQFIEQEEESIDTSFDSIIQKISLINTEVLNYIVEDIKYLDGISTGDGARKLAQLSLWHGDPWPLAAERMLRRMGTTSDWEVWSKWYIKRALGEPISQEEVDVWLSMEPKWLERTAKEYNDELKRRLDAAVNVPAATAEEVPPTPAIGDGVNFDWRDSQLSLSPTSTDSSALPTPTAALLHNRLASRLPQLSDVAAKIANTIPDLSRTLLEYVETASRQTDELDDALFWASGVALMAQASAYERQNPVRTISEPLEPDQLALVLEVAGLHGGLVMSLPQGAALTNKANSAKLPTEIIEEPTLDLIARFAEARVIIEAHAREFLGMQRDAVTVAGWEFGRSGYAAYASVRTLVIRVGEVIVSAKSNPVPTGVAGLAGGFVIKLIAQENGWDIRTATAVFDFLRVNGAQLTNFAQPFPEMSAWVRYILGLLEKDHEVRH